MSASSFMRFRKEIAIAAVAALAGAALVLAGLWALERLSARLSFACPRLLSGLWVPPHGAPWQVGHCVPVHNGRRQTGTDGRARQGSDVPLRSVSS